MTRSIVFACAAMAALVSHASGTKELYEGDDLAEAVAAASVPDEIILDAGTYPITATVVVTNKMVIRGADGTTPDQVVLDGGKTCEMLKFNVSGSALCGVTMTGGKCIGDYLDYHYGAALDAAASTLISNCVFSANTLSGRGACGIVRIKGGSVFTHCVMKDSVFSRGNGYGSSAGLGIRVEGACYVRNSLFCDNKTTTTDHGSSGIVTPIANAKAYVVNCTFVDNALHTGRPLQGYSSGAIYSYNNIFVGNTKDGIAVVGEATFRNCLADIDLSGTDCGRTDASIFADYANGDYALTKNSSAAIDAGSQVAGSTPIVVEATDLAGNDRIMGEDVDIGCYEFDPNERSVVFTVTPDGGTEPIDLTFEATPNGLGEEPTYYWDFDGDGTADCVTTEAILTRSFGRGTYPVTLYASNLTANVGVSYARAEAMVIEQGIAFNPYETDWFFEPFAEPIKVTLSGDLGDTPKFYWDWDGDGVADAVTDDPVLNHTFAAGAYPITVFASNETAGVGISVTMDEPLGVLVRPRVTVAASDPETGVTVADIQKTIDAAGRGSIVTIPKGTYDTHGKTIWVTNELELAGMTGNPEDVVITTTGGYRLMNVSAGTHCLVHSMVFTGGGFSSGTFPVCCGILIAKEQAEPGSNTGRPSAGRGGCVSNVVVRNMSCGTQWADMSAVYVKGSKGRFTHSVISNMTSYSGFQNGYISAIALQLFEGAKADNVLVANCRTVKGNNYYQGRAQIPVIVRGTGSLISQSTIINNSCSFCGGVNVYGGGRFEMCDIAGNTVQHATDDPRRAVWSAYTLAEQAKPTWSDLQVNYDAEAVNAAKESIYSVQTNNAVDVADCLNETTVYATTAELKPIYRKGAWRLPKGSPAIDVVPAKDVSGMPEKDLNGNRRLVNTLYDLGAFELPNPCGLMLLVK